MSATTVSELPPEHLHGGPSACVLSGVVQETGDGLVLIAPELHHKRGRAEEVCGIRNARALSQLRGVEAQGLLHGASIPIGQDHSAPPSRFALGVVAHRTRKNSCGTSGLPKTVFNS